MDKNKYYRDFCIATIKYAIQDVVSNGELRPPYLSKESISNIVAENNKEIKIIQNAYEDGDFTFLHRYYKAVTEELVGCNGFLRENYQFFLDNYGVNLYDFVKKRRDKVMNIIKIGKIKSDSQYHLVMEVLDEFCQTQGEQILIDEMNALLFDYEQRVAKRLEKRKTKTNK